MALSNWDTLAVTLDGQPSDGTFVSPLGVQVVFYKNWLYIRDVAAWREGGAFVPSTVMEIQHGDLRYLDVNIHAVRGPQQGIYAAITSGYGYDNSLRGIIGCGVYGFDEDGRWIGVQPGSITFLQRRRRRRGGSDDWPGDDALYNDVLPRAMRFNQGDAFIVAVNWGATAERKTTFSAFIATATPVGEQDTPLLLKKLRETPFNVRDEEDE